MQFTFDSRFICHHCVGLSCYVFCLLKRRYATATYAFIPMYIQGFVKERKFHSQHRDTLAFTWVLKRIYYLQRRKCPFWYIQLPFSINPLLLPEMLSGKWAIRPSGRLWSVEHKILWRPLQAPSMVSKLDLRLFWLRITYQIPFYVRQLPRFAYTVLCWVFQTMVE